MNPEPINHLRLQIIVCWLLLVGLLNAAPPPNPGTIRLVTKETSLGKVPLMAVMKGFVISPDCRHIAFLVMRGGKWTVCFDGVEGKPYDRVSPCKFSPNSQRSAFVAQRNGKHIVVVDGEESPEFDGVGNGSLLFSPDSRRLAFAAERKGRRVVVVEGKEGPEFDEILHGSVVFSPDSDFNNILSIILGYTSLLKRGQGRSDEGRGEPGRHHKGRPARIHVGVLGSGFREQKRDLGDPAFPPQGRLKGEGINQA